MLVGFADQGDQLELLGAPALARRPDAGEHLVLLIGEGALELCLTRAAVGAVGLGARRPSAPSHVLAHGGLIPPDPAGRRMSGTVAFPRAIAAWAVSWVRGNLSVAILMH